MSENGGPCTSFWEGTETETAAADNLQTDGYPKDNRIKAMLKVDITKHLENYHKKCIGVNILKFTRHCIFRDSYSSAIMDTTGIGMGKRLIPGAHMMESQGDHEL